MDLGISITKKGYIEIGASDIVDALCDSAESLGSFLSCIPEDNQIKVIKEGDYRAFLNYVASEMSTNGRDFISDLFAAISLYNIQKSEEA